MVRKMNRKITSKRRLKDMKRNGNRSSLRFGSIMMNSKENLKVVRIKM